MTAQVILTVAVVTIAVAVIVRLIFSSVPRRAFRRARAARCRRRGHPYPGTTKDFTLRGQKVRVVYCSNCETVTAGDVLTPRRIRRTAARQGVDPVGLVDRNGRPFAKGGKVPLEVPSTMIVGEAGPETLRNLRRPN